MKTGIKNSITALGVFGIMASSLAIAQAAYFDPTPAIHCDTQIIGSLRTGSESNEVYVLQTMLNQGGYMYAAPNGYFGPATRSALMHFQAENGISPTGTVGAATRNAVNERLCDNDVRGDSLNYGYNQYGYNSYAYGYSSGTTYVEKFDPFVKIVSPNPANPTLYTNPPTTQAGIPNVAQISTPQVNASINYSNNGNVVIPTNVTSANPASTAVSSTNVIYSPYIGYTYGVTPQSGVLTIISPLANTTYHEGDTVNLSWTTNNLNASQYQILLENTSSQQNKMVAVTSSMNASFVITKDILDAVCAGTCDSAYNTGAYNTGSFRIVITTPITDIAGVTSIFRAAVSPITIIRPYYGTAQVSISASKTPVNSGEVFRLYVNVPNPYNNSNIYGGYSFKIHAVCVNNVQVSIAGVPCGQEFAMPVTSNYAQQEVPSMITNTSWYRQDVIYEINAVDINGHIVGTARTTVTVNPGAFSF